MTTPNPRRKATDSAILEALTASDGNRAKAAHLLGLTERNFYVHLARLKADGKLTEGVHETLPEHHVIRGVSTLIGPEGDVRAQWVKTKADEEARALAILAATAELCKKVQPQNPVKPPKHTEANLCSLYTLTDCHVGMLSWHRETGEDWDLKIAEQTLTACFAQMIASTPNAKLGIVNQMGDFLHTDSIRPVTPLSGNILDADGRYQKIVEVAVRILRGVVNQALAKHDKVLVLMQDANHDPVGGTWLRAMFNALYDKDNRVSVDTSPSPYIAHQHGKTMLAFHHGHLQKNAQLPILFAAKFAEMWGATTKRYCHTGHRHHVEEQEHSGMTVIQHPTLAAKDAYAARSGWLTERQATSITYHEKFGQVARHTIIPEMVEK